VIVAGLLLTPSAEATICAVPAAAPVTKPVEFTVAAVPLGTDHANAIPLMVAPY
jgi:hypothetical protein